MAAAIWSLQPDGVQEDDAATLGAAVAEGMTQLTVFFAVERRDAIVSELAALLAASNLNVGIAIDEILAQDWSAAWKAHYAPLDIGARLHIVPAWMEPTCGPDRVVVRIDPGQAFGTGTHETTQLVAELLQTIDVRGLRVLDVGTGSGLLAIAAVKLGAASALGVDNDAVAIASAEENLALNQVTARVALAVAESPARLPAARYPLVMVNIISSVLHRLRDDIIARVADGGTLLVSGVLAAEEDAFVAKFVPRNFRVVERVYRAEWVGLRVQAAS